MHTICQTIKQFSFYNLQIMKYKIWESVLLLIIVYYFFSMKVCKKMNILILNSNV